MKPLLKRIRPMVLVSVRIGRRQLPIEPTQSALLFEWAFARLH